MTFGFRFMRVILPAVWFPTVLLLLIVGIYFARRNIYMRRGDLRGAFRISAFAFIAMALGEAFWSHHAYSTFGDFMWWIRGGLAFFLFDAVFIWVCYMAVDPAMRRYWPEQVISWNRFLSGRFRDPLVGRDILIGTAAGAAAAAAMFILKASPGWMYLPGSWSAHIELFSLLGAIKHWGMFFYLLGITVFYGVGYIAAMTVPFIIFRKKWAVVALCVVWVAVNMCLDASGSLQNQLLFGLIASLLMNSCMFRFGIFSTMTAFLTLNLLTRMPLNLEPQRWSGRAAGVTIIIVLAIALYGFYASLGRRPLFARIARDM
jgi:serine/threonine-protein kinase